MTAMARTAHDSEAVLDILALEPWYSGAHRAFLDGLVAHSRHRWHLLTLPGRFWKWRQTGSGLTLGQKALAERPPADLIFASDFVHLPDFLGVTRRLYRQTPSLLYFHENQLVYPLSEHHQLDRAYPLANLSGAAVADHLLFNSGYHQQAFFEAAETVLAASPDHAPKGLVTALAQRSGVLPVGVDWYELAGDRPPRSGPLTLLWNHRWEHDKNPEELFETLMALDRQGADFRLLVAGESYQRQPSVFERVKQQLAHRIDHWGYLPDRAEYVALLQRADVVMSLAHHDFFGLSVVEAMAAGCLPLLANRLNYPDLAGSMGPGCLVGDGAELKQRLKTLCNDPDRARDHESSAQVRRFDWGQVAPAFDRLFVQIKNDLPGQHAP